MPNLPPRAKAKKVVGSTQDRISKFHTSRNWATIRNYYRELQPICERCKMLNQVTKESTEGLSVHHVVMIARCWHLRRSESNLLTLCIPCHSHFTTLERQGQYDQSEQEGQEVKDYELSHLWQ